MWAGVPANASTKATRITAVLNVHDSVHATGLWQDMKML